MDPLLFGLAVGLAIIHLSAGKIRVVDELPRALWVSLAGGVSIAYVFVHILPELQAEQETFREASVAALPYLEHHVYLIALLGFAAFYGVDKLAQYSKERRSEDETSEEVFWVHVASFSVYNAIIGYLLVHRLDMGLWGLAIFFVAIGFHFFVTDSGLRRNHKDAYRRRGRWILAAAIIAGWGIAQVVELPELSIAALFSFLAGGIVLNVVKEEVPEERRSNFFAFVAGAVGYAALLLLM
jgi:zinc transporter ZupT